MNKTAENGRQAQKSDVCRGYDEEDRDRDGYPDELVPGERIVAGEGVHSRQSGRKQWQCRQE